MPRREKGDRPWNKTRRIHESKKKKDKNKSTKTKQTAESAGAVRRKNPPRDCCPLTYSEMPVGEFARKLGDGMNEEDKQRLETLLAGDESCPSASDDGSCTEVCYLFRRIVGSSVRVVRTS